MIKETVNKKYIKAYEKPTASFAWYFAAPGYPCGWLFLCLILGG